MGRWVWVCARCETDLWLSGKNRGLNSGGCAAWFGRGKRIRGRHGNVFCLLVPLTHKCNARVVCCYKDGSEEKRQTGPPWYLK